jgi:3-dehydroquinate dehydratase
MATSIFVLNGPNLNLLDTRQPETCGSATLADVPTVEMHISNIPAREEFRHHSYVSRGARAVICGFGIQGHRPAVAGLAAMVGAEAQP